MQNVLTASPLPSIDTSPSRSDVPGRVVAIAALAALWLVLCKHLSSEWSLNEQYSYGWFVPFFAAYLFWLRWEAVPTVQNGNSEVKTAATIPRGSRFLLSTSTFLLLAALLPLRLYELGNPDWRPLGWFHVIIVVALTLVVLWRVGGTAWLRHFAFPVCFIFVAVPWVSAIETPIIQGLMQWVAAVSAETLNLFGIPAQVEGNLIRVSTGLVGVNEACSGVRSLQTSIMIGLLFGELKRLSLWRRVGLLASALVIALIANCARALFLVTLATNRADSVDRWHDIAGYSIVAAVFIGTMTVAALLAPKVESQKAKVEDDSGATAPQRSFYFPLSTSYFSLLLAWLVVVEVAVEAWYRAHERDLAVEKRWSVTFPEHAPAYREVEIEEQVRRTLRFDHGREATWAIPPAGAPAPAKTTLRTYAFFFRWDAKGSSVVRARAHRPDVCLPSAGWSMMRDRGTGDYRVGDLEVPFRRNIFQLDGGSAVAYTFFCLQEDRRRPNEERPDLLVSGGAQPDWSLVGRTRVVRNGVRNLGQQVLEVILLAPAPLDERTVDEEFSRMLQGMITPHDSRS